MSRPIYTAARMGRELAKPRSIKETMSYVYEHGLRVMKPAYEPEEVREVLRAILVALSRVPIIEQFPRNSSIPGIGEKLGSFGIKMVVGFTTGIGLLGRVVHRIAIQYRVELQF